MRRKQARQLDGILLLDKTAGMSSNRALQCVRGLYGAAKAGHTGSLDPLATGLLPICFGEATKIAGLLLGSRKAYETTARLGVTTDTDDADGRALITRLVPPLRREEIEAALLPLHGRIQQRAPIYSALKQGGEPLYAKARRGEPIEAPVRGVDVHGIALLDIDGDRLQLRIECGSGTYVRSLVRDLGETLGCGAHVEALRRLWVEPFVQPRMYSHDELQRIHAESGTDTLDACLLPIEAGLAGFPRVQLDADAIRALGFGQAVACEPGSEGVVAAFDGDGRALGLGRRTAEGRFLPQRLFRWAVAVAVAGGAALRD